WNVAEIPADLEVVGTVPVANIQREFIFDLPAVLGAKLVEVAAVCQARENEPALNALKAKPRGRVVANVSEDRRPRRRNLIHRVRVLESELVQPRGRGHPCVAEDGRTAGNRLI